MDVTLDGGQHQRLQLSGLAADAQAARGVVRQIVLQALADRLRLGGPVRAHSSASRASSWRSIALPLCSTVCRRGCRRSEEHTSELQSLMRISYAVFCLKKKKTQNQYIYKETETDIHTIPI